MQREQAGGAMAGAEGESSGPGAAGGGAAYEARGGHEAQSSAAMAATDATEDAEVAEVLAAAAAIGGVAPADAGAIVSLLLHAQAVWASPLARCVQTAMVALQPLMEPAGGDGQALPLDLKPNARERRELRNLHTSIGNSCGAHIQQRCLSKLREVSGTEGEGGIDDGLARLHLSTTEVGTQWWSTNPEPEREYANRVQELLTQLQYCPHDSVILVAHHDTLHQLLHRHLDEDAADRHRQLVSQLRSGPAPPCALLWCCLDFRHDAARPITDLALISDALRGAGAAHSDRA